MPSESTSGRSDWFGVADTIHEPLEGVFELLEAGPVTDGKGLARFVLAYTSSHLFVAKMVVDGDRKDRHRMAWAEVIDSCGNLALDIGITALSAPSGVGLFIGGTKAFIDGLQCGADVHRLVTAYQGGESYWDGRDGRRVMAALDVVEVVLDVHGAWKSVRRIERISHLPQRVNDPSRLRRLQNMQLHEASKLLVVHLPNVVFATGNLITGDGGLLFEDLPRIFDEKRDASACPPVPGESFGPSFIPGGFPYPLLDPYPMFP